MKTNQNTPDELAILNHMVSTFNEAVRLGTKELQAFYADGMLARNVSIEGDKVIIKPIDTDKIYRTEYAIVK